MDRRRVRKAAVDQLAEDGVGMQGFHPDRAIEGEDRRGRVKGCWQAYSRGSGNGKADEMVYQAGSMLVTFSGS